MPIKTSFDAPLPTTNMITGNPLISLTASIDGNKITITETDIIGSKTESQTYQINADNDTTFMVPDNLHKSTTNMLVGIGQRMMQLKANGFTSKMI